MVCGVNKVRRAEFRKKCSLFGVDMEDVYSLTAATTARKEAEARAARKAYEKRKTR